MNRLAAAPEMLLLFARCQGVSVEQAKKEEKKNPLWLYSHIQGVTGVPSHLLAQDNVHTRLLKRLCTAAQLALSEHCSYI